MLVGWVPVVAYLGCFRGADGRLEPLGLPDSRGPWFLVVLGLSAATASIPVLLTARGAGGGGYTSMFGTGGIEPLRVAEIFQRMLLPWPVAQGNEGPVFSLPALTFLVALVLGLRTAATDSDWAGHARRSMVLGLALPAIGTVLYLPWPTYWAPYGLPFLVGFSVLIATAITSAERRSPKLGIAVRAITALGVLLVMAPPVHLVRRLAARQDVNVALAGALPARTHADSVIIALSVPPRPGIPGIGSALRKYALVLDPGAVLPPVIDAHCPDVGERLRRGLGRTVVISYADQCGRLPTATLTARRSFHYFDLSRMRVVGDSILAQLLDPIDLPRPPR
jgi:hypothetical protein